MTSFNCFKIRDGASFMDAALSTPSSYLVQTQTNVAAASPPPPPPAPPAPPPPDNYLSLLSNNLNHNDDFGSTVHVSPTTSLGACILSTKRDSKHVRSSLDTYRHPPTTNSHNCFDYSKGPTFYKPSDDLEMIPLPSVGGLVRSQSDLTCLSVKADSKSQPSDGDDNDDDKDGNMVLSKQGSLESVCVDKSNCALYAPIDVTKSLIGEGGRGGGESSTHPNPVNKKSVNPCFSSSSPFGIVHRTYQLVCRDGVQSYELIEESDDRIYPVDCNLSQTQKTHDLFANHQQYSRDKACHLMNPNNPTNAHNRLHASVCLNNIVLAPPTPNHSNLHRLPFIGQQASNPIHLGLAKPTAPLPARKQQPAGQVNVMHQNYTMSTAAPSYVNPPTSGLAPIPNYSQYLLSNSSKLATQTVAVSSAAIKKAGGASGFVNCAQTHEMYDSKLDGAGTVGGCVGHVNYRNSGGSSDLATPNSPHRSPHSTEANLVSTAAVGMPLSKNAPKYLHHSHDIQPSRANNSHEAVDEMDETSQMTINELRSIAQRQRQQLARQMQQLEAREERRAWLRSVHSQRATHDNKVVDDKLLTSTCTPPLSSGPADLSHEQEVKLQKFRGFRSQSEQIRLTNKNLVKEISQLSSVLSAKEHDLQSNRQRTDEAERLLALISQWRTVIRTAHQTVHKVQSGDITVDTALTFPYMQPPFKSDVDKKRWHDGLIEADYLDRKFAAVGCNQKLPIQTWSSALVPDVPPTSCVNQETLTAHNTFHLDQPEISSLPLTSTPSSTSFGSLLTRTSSPPSSNRKSTLRTLLNAGIMTKEEVQLSNIHPMPRIKAPPRYASRAVINDTYMRRICRDSVEKYKRTASEVYLANVSRISAKPSENAAESVQDESKSPHSSLSHSPASSSSSLELVGLNVEPVLTIDRYDDDEAASRVVDDDEPRQHSADVDSGLGGSDPIAVGLADEQKTQSILRSLSATTATLEVEKKCDASALLRPDQLINELSNKDVTDFPFQQESGLEQSLDHKEPKSILRKCKKSSISNVSTDEIQVNTTETRSNNVRFHPLALLLDAALEGDLELVKKAANEVSDVSEPNDEGITALHNAVCAGRLDIAEFLVLTVGADVNAGDTDGWTPLHCAASCGNLSLARLLVEHGASLHARTFSDRETPLEKCDQGDDEAECEEYLFFQQERLGTAASGRVYVLFPRGLEAAGPGSPESNLDEDELPVWPNEELSIVQRDPPGETEWMLARNSQGRQGLVPRSHISCYPLVRIPPASLPITQLPAIHRESLVSDAALDNLEGGGADAVKSRDEVGKIAIIDEEMKLLSRVTDCERKEERQVPDESEISTSGVDQAEEQQFSTNNLKTAC